MNKAALKPTIREGQAYVDEPVYIEVSKARPLALALNSIGVKELPRPLVRPRFVVLPSIDMLSHYERVCLRWMKPDGHGGLIEA